MILSRKGLLDFFRRNLLLKVGLFNAASVFLRIIFAYITNKIIVVWLGPVGTALTEQVRNFVQAVQGVATVGLNEGVIRYSSIYQDRDRRLVKFLSATYRLILVVSLIFMLLILIFAKRIDAFLFPGHSYLVFIYVIAILTPIYALQLILLAVLQGFQQYKKVTFFISLLHFFSMLLTLILVIQMQMVGALLSIIFSPVLGFIIILIIARSDLKKLLIFPISNGGKTNGYKHYFKRLIPFIWMAGITAVIIPVFTIMIRNLIIHNFQANGVEIAGYWDAVRKISSFYFMFITPVFSMYYFPKISRIKDSDWLKEIKNMILRFYPFVFLGMLLIFVFKKYVTLIVFSDAYEPMNRLYLWQIAGDAVRLFSLLLAYRMWAKVMVNTYIFSEVSYWILYYLLSLRLIEMNGLLGVMQAFLLTNFFYLGVMLFVFRKNLLGLKK